jgi:hypothetical protein
MLCFCLDRINGGARRRPSRPSCRCRPDADAAVAVAKALPPLPPPRLARRRRRTAAARVSARRGGSSNSSGESGATPRHHDGGRRRRRGAGAGMQAVRSPSFTCRRGRGSIRFVTESPYGAKAPAARLVRPPQPKRVMQDEGGSRESPLSGDQQKQPRKAPRISSDGSDGSHHDRNELRRTSAASSPRPRKQKVPDGLSPVVSTHHHRRHQHHACHCQRRESRRESAAQSHRRNFNVLLSSLRDARLYGQSVAA